MKLIKSKLLITALTTVVLGSMSASAQLIYSTNYDVGNTYSQNDTAAPVISVFSAYQGNTNGVAGTAALSLEFNSTDVADPGDFAVNMFSNQFSVGTATSSVAANYTLEFDISALGLTSTPNTMNLDIKFDPFGANVSRTIENLAITTTGFQLLTFNLATDLGFTVLTAANINAGFQLKFYTYNNAVGKFGRDTGNAIFVDNVTLTQVPEPTSLALLALGGLSLFGFRRRS